jgi:hypothetical protein
MKHDKRRKILLKRITRKIYGSLALDLEMPDMGI